MRGRYGLSELKNPELEVQIRYETRSKRHKYKWFLAYIEVVYRKELRQGWASVG